MFKSFLISLSIGLALAPAALATEAAPDAAPPGEQIVCKRIAETGSRVKKVKVCKTKAEWRDVERSAEDAAKRLDAAGARKRTGWYLGPEG